MAYFLGLDGTEQRRFLEMLRQRNFIPSAVESSAQKIPGQHPNKEPAHSATEAVIAQGIRSPIGINDLEVIMNSTAL